MKNVVLVEVCRTAEKDKSYVYTEKETELLLTVLADYEVIVHFDSSFCLLMAAYQSRYGTELRIVLFQVVTRDQRSSVPKMFAFLGELKTVLLV